MTESSPYLTAQIRPLSYATRQANAADPRPWLDVRPSDYTSEDFVATQAAARAILQRCLDEGLRLRLILSEATDLAHPLRDPLSPHSYRIASTGMMTEAVETVIELRNGRCYLCTGLHGWERGFV